jgi:hypothetical protein
MSLRKKKTNKALVTEASGSGRKIEDGTNISKAVYNDTYGFLEKGEDALRWGDIYHMFKKKKFATDIEDQDELKIFKNIIKFGIYRVETRSVVFPCTDAIS